MKNTICTILIALISVASFGNTSLTPYQKEKVEQEELTKARERCAWAPILIGGSSVISAFVMMFRNHNCSTSFIDGCITGGSSRDECINILSQEDLCNDARPVIYAAAVSSGLVATACLVGTCKKAYQSYRAKKQLPTENTEQPYTYL